MPESARSLAQQSRFGSPLPSQPGAIGFPRQPARVGSVVEWEASLG